MSARRIVLGLVFLGATLLPTSQAIAAKLQSKTVRAWDRYVALIEERIENELESGDGFLVREFLPTEQAEQCEQTIDWGGICVAAMETRDKDGRAVGIPSGMVHHWMGSVFIPDVSLQDLLEWVQNYSQHDEWFPEVEESRLLARDGDSFQIFLRLKRQKVVTVFYNTEHDVEYRRHGPNEVSGRSGATRIAQVENPGEEGEREKAVGNDSGFLWRLNSYWRYQQVDGGVVVECESIGLSRGIPVAVKWLVSPFLQSVPRESLESTLSSIRQGSRQLATDARRKLTDPPTPPVRVSPGTGGYGAVSP